MSGSGGSGSAGGAVGAEAAAGTAGAEASGAAGTGATAAGAAGACVAILGAGVDAAADGAGADGPTEDVADAALEAEAEDAVEAAGALAPPFIWRSENAKGAPAACCNARASSCCTSGFCTTRKANSLSAGNSMTSDEDAESKTALVVRNSAP